MVFGLEQMIIIKKTFPSAELKLVIINQDIVENIFWQVRSFNGQNAHPQLPTVHEHYQYCEYHTNDGMQKGKQRKLLVFAMSQASKSTSFVKSKR